MRERRKNLSASKVAIIGLLLVVGVFVVPQFSFAAFSEPGTTPLTGTPPTFLNGSSATQTKVGSLLIGPSGGTSALCLNADTTKSIRDPANVNPINVKCIDAWSDVAPAGSFVRRQQNVTPSDPANPRVYGTADRGFATVIGNGADDQGLSTVVKVNTAASGTQPRYAVYATDSGANARSAAQLSGRSVIFKIGSSSEELCLNGQCITQWSGAFGFGNAGVVRLQNTTTLIPDMGNASVSGATRLTRGLTLGRPTATTSRLYTYGDGQCTDENGENATNSPNDCN